jgi:hypothetical protein
MTGTIRLCEAMLCADELDIRLVPKVGAAWMARGIQLAVMTAGQHQEPCPAEVQLL